MKKTVLSVLIVLLLSVVMIGCGGDVCEVCGEPSKDCICQAAGSETIPSAVLTELGIQAGDVLAPVGTTFLGAEKNVAGTVFTIYWKDANQAMYDYYKDAWMARSTDFVTEKTNGKFGPATIMFKATGGKYEMNDNTYPDGTIIFHATKK